MVTLRGSGMVEEGVFKDRPAVILKSGDCRMAVLPEDGGKIASITKDGFEFLEQAPGDRYLRLAEDGSFVESECSAFDDMFPTVDPCKVGKYVYPDHGAVCRTGLTYSISGETLRMVAKLKNLPFLWEKEVRSLPSGFEILYRITNLSGEKLPYLYAAHFMLKGSDDLEIDTPYGENADAVYMFGREFATLPQNRLTGKRAAGPAYKYYYTDKITEGKIVARYHGRALTLLYDKEELPYIGVWLNNGSFKGMYNIATEIASAPYDSPLPAEEKGVCSYLLPKERKDIRLHILLD